MMLNLIEGVHQWVMVSANHLVPCYRASFALAFWSLIFRSLLFG